jgi:hypothetical protein
MEKGILLYCPRISTERSTSLVFELRFSLHTKRTTRADTKAENPKSGLNGISVFVEWAKPPLTGLYNNVISSVKAGN